MKKANITNNPNFVTLIISVHITYGHCTFSFITLFSIEQLILDIFINGSLMFQCTMDHLTNPIIIGHSGCFHFPILDIVAMNILIHASFTPNQLFLKKYIYRNL